MKHFIYILDEEDTFSVVDMIEHTGTSYLPQVESMKPCDIVYIATLEYGGRLLYRMEITALYAWQADNGEDFCDSMAVQSMEISSSLLLRHYGLAENQNEGDEVPHLLDSRMASRIEQAFDEMQEASLSDISDEDYQLKRKIIYDAFRNDR